ncbi:MAG: ABC transporter ATP-binding protein [Clostridia bacterium]|nr:ABC transporter ATP-binding protein [Clostridia bacterium]
MQAIKIENLTKKYKDVVAVNNLNLTIEEGTLFALLGINGAGKTTTIRCLCCLTKPTNGNAYLLENSILTESKKVKEIIGVSPQETAIANNLTVLENLNFVCGIYNFNKEERVKKVNELLEKFALKEVANKKASKLSGGYKRRLSIALSLISNPKILFLDEPTLGLDVISRSELWQNILELKGKMTIVLTTHYMEEAEKLADKIGIMKNGVLVAVGTCKELKEKTNKTTLEDAFIEIIKGAN